eukprot:ANDGO_02020.mRNA.1 Coiled-coil domain-containing protein 25 homolog
MVFFFVSSETGYMYYMGKDKFENEELIKHAWPEDIWFHVDNLSSAHVYVRLREGETFDGIPDSVVAECAQLTKANSIKGCKEASVRVVYTPASNLKKTGDMEVGQVSFHNGRLVRYLGPVEADKEALKRLNKTKEEKFPNLAQERIDRDRRQREAEHQQRLKEKDEEKKRIEEGRKLAAQKNYQGMFNDEDRMMSNRENAGRSLDDDFM